MLVLYSLLAMLATANLTRWFRSAGPGRSGGGVLLTLVGVRFLAQLYSVTLPYRVQEFSRRFNAAVHSAPAQAVVTNTWFVPQRLHRVF